MNIDEVIAQFESEHKGKYSIEDRARIVAALNSLGLSEFSIRYRNDVKNADGNPYSIYFYDSTNLVHVHPTMIVAKREFEGFQPGIRSKYSSFPQMAQLSNWTSQTKTGRPLCPHCFVEIPLVGKCGICEFDLEDIDPDDLDSD